MVTVLYWSLLFPLFGYTTFVDVHLHLINAVIILADLWLSRLPYWLLHFPAPLTFLCAYVFFAAIYYVAGGYAPGHKDYIYPWLDFGRLGVTIPIILLVVFVIFPAVHACLWLFERAARQRTMAREKREARQRMHAFVVDSERESKMEQGEIKAGRAQQEELSYQFAEDEAKSESAQVYHTMDQCQDHHERNESCQVYFDAVSPSEGSGGIKEWRRHGLHRAGREGKRNNRGASWLGTLWFFPSLNAATGPEVQGLNQQEVHGVMLGDDGEGSTGMAFYDTEQGTL